MPDGAIRVLVCDDHRVVADGIALVLAGQQDIEVVGIAGSVAEVRELARSRRPHVVLMDYALPDGDGVEATVLLKDEAPAVATVMLTSFTDEEVLVRAIDAGCSGFVTKHKGTEDIVAAVRLAAAGEAVVSPDLLARLLPRIRRSQPAVGADLTRRERDVLERLAEGESKEQIAAKLFLSVNTVRNHIQSILTKLGAHSRLEAVAIAAREGVLHRH